MFHVLYLIVNMTDTNNRGSIQGTVVHMRLAMKALKSFHWTPFRVHCIYPICISHVLCPIYVLCVSSPVSPAQYLGCTAYSRLYSTVSTGISSGIPHTGGHSVTIMG